MYWPDVKGKGALLVHVKYWSNYMYWIYDEAWLSDNSTRPISKDKVTPQTKIEHVLWAIP